MDSYELMLTRRVRNACSIATTIQMRHGQVSLAAERGEYPMIKPAFHHVNLKTTRLQEIIDWYGVVVGTTVNSQSNNIAFISNRPFGDPRAS